MRSRTLSMILLASSVAACAPAAPSTGPAPQRPADAPPVRALLSERDALSLTSSQVTALDSVARAWQATDDALARRLGRVKARGLHAARTLLPGPADALAAVAENNRRAAEAVARILTPGQRQAVCESSRASADRAAASRGGEGRGTRMFAGGKERGSRTEAKDLRGKVRRAWPWCAEPDQRRPSSRSER